MQEIKDKFRAILDEKAETRIKQLREATQTIQLDKGLSRDDALKAARPKMKGDHRGFSYNPDTGVAKYI